MKFIASLVVLASFFYTASIGATEQTNNQSVTIACSISIPPFVIHQNDRGIMLDMLRTALAHENIATTFTYDSNEQNTKRFNHGELDALCNSTHELTPSAWLSSEPIITFKNYAISLERDEIQISNISDLNRYRVTAFSFAQDMLSTEFAKAVSSAPYYAELTDQIEQLRSLFSGNADVVIMEQTMFRYLLSKLRRDNPTDTSLHLAVHYSDIFPTIVYHAAFKEQAIRDHFDRGFKYLKDNGEENAILDNYGRLLDNYLFR